MRISDWSSDVCSSDLSGIGYHLDRLDGPRADAEGDTDDLPENLAHRTPAYRRALWIVLLLTIGYGSVEMVGGFLSGSQALKADAPDFLGDGLITFSGIIAIGWSVDRKRVVEGEGV